MKKTASSFVELLRLSRAGDPEAREELVRSNLRLVYHLASRFCSAGIEREDIVQAGCLGLLKALDRFDPSYQVCFSTYAVPVILGEMRRLLRDRATSGAGRRWSELSRKAAAERERLAQEKGREPSLAEIAACLDIDREELVAALEASRPPLSLQGDWQQPDGERVVLVERVAGAVAEEERWVTSLSLREELRSLPERERALVTLRFFRNLTQAQVACILGLSQAQVSRLEKQILQRLRKSLQD